MADLLLAYLRMLAYGLLDVGEVLQFEERRSGWSGVVS
jgi:hypothetical protein